MSKQNKDRDKSVEKKQFLVILFMYIIGTAAALLYSTHEHYDFSSLKHIAIVSFGAIIAGTLLNIAVTAFIRYIRK